MSALDGYELQRGSGSIVTPEAVVLDFELAGVASRSIAIVVDIIVQLLALLALVFVVGLAAIGSDVVGIVLLLVGLILVIIGYPVAMETLNNGRSFGRMIVGTRVVTVEGAPVRFRHAFIRALLAIVDLFASSGAIAVVTALITRRGQRLGDLVAGTMVIRERKDVGSGWMQPMFAAPGLVMWAKDIDTSPLGDDGYQVVRDYLRRAPELGPDQAAALGADIERFVTQRMPLWPRPEHASVVDWLRTIAAKAQGSGLAPPPPPSPVAPASAQGRAMPPPPPGYGPGSAQGRTTPPPPPGYSSGPPPPPAVCFSAASSVATAASSVTGAIAERAAASNSPTTSADPTSADPASAASARERGRIRRARLAQRRHHERQPAVAEELRLE